MARRKKSKKEKVWAYLLKNKLATAKEVAKATGVSYTYVNKLMNSIGTPKEIFQQEEDEFTIEEMIEPSLNEGEGFPKPMGRAEILQEATRLTTDAREKTHGTMADNLGCIADLWNAYLKGRWHNLTGSDVALMMTLVKVSRAKNNPCHADNWVDGAGYMACGGEIGTENVEFADLTDEKLPLAEGQGL